MVTRTTQRTRRRAAALALGAAVLGGVPAPVLAHPLHVSYADVAVVRGTATVTVRAYTDDLVRAAGGAARIAAYVRAHFGLVDASGRAVPLASCGTAVRGDMTHVCLRGAAPPGGVRLANDLLVTLYADQINVVRAVGGRTVLFTRDRRVQTL